MLLDPFYLDIRISFFQKRLNFNKER